MPANYPRIAGRKNGGMTGTVLWKSPDHSILRSSRALPNYSEAILLCLALLQCALQIFIKRKPRFALLPAGNNDSGDVIERALNALGCYRFGC